MLGDQQAPCSNTQTRTGECRYERSAMAVSQGNEELVSRHFDELAVAAREAASAASVVHHWGQHLSAVFVAGGKLLACGNGGSAAEAQHLTGELLGRFQAERRPLPAIALTANSSAVTAIANDYGTEQLFARQVHAYGRRGDVLVALSTSGTSRNVIAAAKAGLDLGVTVWALTGPAPNPLAALADSAIAVAAPTAATVQEIHLSLVHALCIALDEALQAPA
jgi:D-sedoheptulose 7-phosphate isomerase